jgi:hypothetical protein
MAARPKVSVGGLRASMRAMPALERTSQEPIFQIKVSLLQVEPTIWRRILVPAEVTLAELHYVVNEAMGWTGSHSHSFTFEKRSFGDLELDPHNELKFEDESEVTLESLADKGQKLNYEYDFGDGWEHEIEIENRVGFDARLAYPLCIGGARACPPEDSHGPHGYQEFLAAIRDKTHPEHEQALTWIGGFFDPEGFDPNRTNLAIREMYEGADCEDCDGNCDCDHHGHDHDHDHDHGHGSKN